MKEWLKKYSEALFSLTGGLIALVAGVWSVFTFHEQKPIPDLNQTSILIHDIKSHVESITKETIIAYKEVNDRISNLETELNDINNKLKYISSLPADSKVAIGVQSLKNNVENTRIRVDKLENALLATPSKALEVPLLRQELDDIKSAQRDRSEHVKDLLKENVDRLSESVSEAKKSLSESVDRVYDFNKWLLGGLCIGIISLAISNLLKAAEKPRATSKEAD